MRKSISAAACFLLCLSLLAGPVSAAANGGRVIAQNATQTTGTINGTVRDPQGNPLGGASITVTGNGQSITATSAGDGTFSVSPPPGIYTVLVTKGGYQSNETDDVAVTAGSSVAVNFPLSVANLQSLRVIGRTSTTTRNRFNGTEESIASLPPQEIGVRQTNNLTDIVNELPGVTIQRSFSSTPNTNFVVRGDPIQTKVFIDGHPVSSGIFGQYNTNYQESGIFNGVQLLKGAGLNGPDAGEVSVGAVNLTTLDFSPRDTANLQLGLDSYNGSFYRVNAAANTLNGKLQIVAAKDFVGYRGPYDNLLNANRLNTSGSNTANPQFATLQVPSISGIDQWQGDFSNRYALQSELAKLRINFSTATAFTASFLGLQGQYEPQGGSYATYYGHTTLAACNNPSGAAAGAGLQTSVANCTLNATYGPPYTFGLAGQVVDGYSWFPNSFIQNNEPYFFGELRTTLKNDTFLFRPYTGIINRYISGANENSYPGNGGGWQPVTNAANCTIRNIPATATAGASGPCFPLTAGATTAPYVVDPQTPHTFPVSSTPLTCSPTPPYTCYTTTTAQENNGQFGYGTPFSQPELDQLHGYTFQYIHPVAQNLYTFSFDYNSDYSQSASGDQTVPPPGCQLVVGSVRSNFATFQPNCPLATQATAPFLPRSSIGTPPTLIQKNDFALTGQWQLSPQVQLYLGNYYTQYTANAQIENPRTLSRYAALGNSSAAPVDLVTQVNRSNHYDPHIGVTFRPSPDISIRANGGSSITVPYAGLISGFGSVTLPNAANNQTLQFSTPNVNLLPETTVTYDLGADIRIAPSVLSFDLFDTTVHNVFLQSTNTVATTPVLTTQSQNINGPISRSYGIELTAQNTPPLGFGYYVTGTLQRAYNDQLPLSIYSVGGSSFLVNGEQIFGIPYAKGYAEIRYSAPHNTLLTLGADYEGTNNSTYGAPYTLLNASLRTDVVPGTTLGLSIENLNNINVGNGIGRALYDQGAIQPTLGLISPGGGLGYNLAPSNGLTNLQGLPYRTVRFTITQHI